MTSIYFLRAGRAAPDDVMVRTPELRPLKDRTVALFGLGCIGAPIAMELARAGIGELRILDCDYVDSATIGRWPFGLTAAGLYKAPFIKSFLDQNYPATTVSSWVHRIGGVHLDGNLVPGARVPSDGEVMEKMTTGASIMIDATAEIGVQQFLSDYSRRAGIAYIGASGTGGAWGGKVFRFVPGITEGCWLCYRHALEDSTIPPPPNRPDDEVQAVGCADPTFTGAGFDLLQISLSTVRTAVATLCAGTEGAYPRVDWDVSILEFRDPDGNLIPTRTRTYQLRKHPKCEFCNAC